MIKKRIFINIILYEFDKVIETVSVLKIIE